ncbi:MAG: rhodanese-related sulfurtransferase [Pseudomonadota bacterium]
MTRAAKTVATFYRFVAIDAPAALRERLLARGEALGLEGTILLAGEGINATIAGPAAALEAFLDDLQQDPRFTNLVIKRSELPLEDAAFLRFKVKLKDEIVTLGQGPLPVAETPARHVGAAEWNRLLDDPSVRVIDVRNRYEIETGSFSAAEDPGTDSFREFPVYVATALDPAVDRQLAIFCTGGIRCEKAAAYLAQAGFDNVVQLDGGVLNYLAEVEPGANRWRGECFVFDQRVTVNAELEPGGHVQCHACRRPVSAAAQRSPDYVYGVSCPACVAETAPEDRARFAERIRQVRLADDRGDAHLGPRAQGGGQPAADADLRQQSDGTTTVS